MPAFGGYAPGAERYGGAVPTLQRVLESLNAQRGTAYNTDPTSSVWVENMAFARAIVGLWEFNERLSYQNDPQRMTATLSRWERILGLSPAPNDTPVARRVAVWAKFQRLGQPVNTQYVSDQLSAVLGPVFVKLVHLDPTDANYYWPGAPPGNASTAAVPWYSTIAHVLVKTQIPAAWSQMATPAQEALYQATIAKVAPVLDGILPSWATWTVYRNGTGHPAGPWAKDAGAGFYLNDPHNLDNEVFDR